MKTKPKKPSAEELIIRSMIKAIGENPDREGLQDTPARVVRSWKEIYGGYAVNPRDLLKVSFGEKCDEMILAKDIDFYSTCEHHLLPFYGTAHVAYLPAHDRVVGYSKLPRVVDAFARRMQIQERLTRQIGEAILEACKPIGVAVVLEAAHHCARCRGIRSPRGKMRTQYLRGCFLSDPASRSEFMMAIK